MVNSVLRLGGVGALLLLPVWWTERVQAVDLPSHSYNVWLAQLIRQGEIEGLRIEPLLVNVMFESGMDFLLGWFTFPDAERIAVGGTLLILCGGLSLWVRAVSGRFRWELAPLLLVASHGLITQAGFVNFTLSLGFGGAAGAALLGGSRLRWLALPAFLASVVANPLGAAMLLALSVYALMARQFSGVGQAVLFGLASVGLVVCAAVITIVFDTFRVFHPLAFLGASILVPYRIEYLVPAVLYLFVIGTMLVGASRAEGASAVWACPPGQMTLLASIACLLLPSGVLFPGHVAYITYIDQRIALMVVFTTLSWIGALELPRVAWIGSTSVALLYFGLLAADHQAFSRMDRILSEAVIDVPERSRVIFPHRAEGYLLDPLLHAIDRACLGHCFSYLNYEPASRHFRIRAAPGNEVVVSERERVGRFEYNDLEIESGDIPLFQVVLEEGRFLIRQSKPGERVRRVPIPLPSRRSSPF